MYTSLIYRSELMLVLGRKPGEFIIINENIIVKVIKSEDGHLRLAIDAPKDVNIIRGELIEEKKQTLVKELELSCFRNRLDPSVHL